MNTTAPKTTDVKNVMTPEFRVSYPALYTPRRSSDDPNAEAKYSLAMLFKKGENLTALKAAAKAAIVEKWGADEAKWPKNLRSPFRDQGEKSGDGYEAGAIFINASSKQKPGVVNNRVEKILDESEVYAGCWGRASVRAYAYDQKGNRGVAFGLQNFQKTKEGDPISGRTRAEDDFTAVDVGEGGTAGDVFAAEGKPAAKSAGAGFLD